MTWIHHPTNKQVIIDEDTREVIAVVRAPGNRNDIGDANAERIIAAVSGESKPCRHTGGAVSNIIGAIHCERCHAYLGEVD